MVVTLGVSFGVVGRVVGRPVIEEFSRSDPDRLVVSDTGKLGLAKTYLWAGRWKHHHSCPSHPSSSSTSRVVALSSPC